MEKVKLLMSHQRVPYGIQFCEWKYISRSGNVRSPKGTMTMDRDMKAQSKKKTGKIALFSDFSPYIWRWVQKWKKNVGGLQDRKGPETILAHWCAELKLCSFNFQLNFRWVGNFQWCLRTSKFFFEFFVNLLGLTFFNLRFLFQFWYQIRLLSFDFKSFIQSGLRGLLSNIYHCGSFLRIIHCSLKFVKADNLTSDNLWYMTVEMDQTWNFPDCRLIRWFCVKKFWKLVPAQKL